MKKVAVWLSDEERDALARYCEREGRSMYSVLKEAVAHTIQGEAPIAPIAPITPKEDGGLVAPPVKAVQAVSPELEEWKGTVERGQYNLAKEVDKLKVNEKLWHDVSELKAGMGELRGLVSGLLLKLTKTEELEDKLDRKTVDTVAKVLKNLGFGGIKEGV